MRRTCLIIALLAGCARPGPDSYVGGKRAGAVSVPVGMNEAGEACTQNAGAGAREAAVYCGSWQQPSARLLAGGPGTERDLASLATSSSWRSGLDQRLVCEGAAPTRLLQDSPAVMLSCTRRVGGWPQVAVVTLVGGQVWYGDGVRPALPAMARGIGVLSGTLQPQLATATGPAEAGLTAQRLAATSFGSNDIGQYQGLVRAASRANQEGNPAGAESALRAAVALQERVLGPQAPALATTLAAQALQASNEGHVAAATALFARAERLALLPDQPNPDAVPLLRHYQALDRLNRGQPAAALPLLDTAEAGYIAVLPPATLRAGAAPAGGHGFAALASTLETQRLLADPLADEALLGVVEVRRARAAAFRRLGRTAESEQAAMSAFELARSHGLTDPAVQARLARTAAYVALAGGRQGAALTSLSQSAAAFGAALPGSRTYAETSFLLAGELARAGRKQEARVACRTAIGVLSEARLGTSGALLSPCLDLYAEAAAASPDKAQPIFAEMFEAAQLTQGSVTSEQIAQASARLAENRRDPRVAALIRGRDDANQRLADLYATRDAVTAGTDRTPLAEVQKDIDQTRAKLAETDSALQAASPNYGQLVQLVVRAPEVMAALRPDEAFAASVLSGDSGWMFLIRRDRLAVAPIPGGTSAVARLVTRVRASMDADTEPPAPFDTEAAAALYTLLFGRVADGLRGATALTVAPSGPLLSLPFGVLLTGPARQDALAEAPWLIRDMVVAHVPAAANFVSLRRLAGGSRADRPWFGFGDFHPVSQAQAERSFPVASCADSAKLLAGLPPLPGADVELAAMRQLERAGPEDALTGAAFTADAVRKASLKRYRILHFATHALLPTDLACQSESALVTSPPPHAADATGALLTASEVAGLDLDADAVILSACNTGGPAGAGAGESLSGLARSFFYAGARGLLVTHWSVNDRMAAYLVVLTMDRFGRAPQGGLAGALAAAQRRVLSEAHGDLAGEGHPFYWGALAAIEGGRKDLAGGT